ncbi:hypothetical protein NQ315_004755 [Exocentrus adspersus]|uniref:Small ribosomal subunit protein mS26 n=1 Tax=Exocentrus adspersus TaxID=1586481 RepID=A0AAV8W3C5_9CUCU|nr:hypothetical protein NQ315_004755 [Exocentrus adspersus]
MLRLTNNFRTLYIAGDILNSNPHLLNSQSVRWRKPRWVPKAKSKIFRVPPRLVLPEDERIELMRLNANYKTQMKSIRKYLFDKYSNLNATEADPETQRKEFEEDFARCMEINNKWNDEQRVLREKRVAEELEAELDFARKAVELKTEKQIEQLETVEEIVRREKELSKSYILPENIDAAIEHALANPVDYNFAVNLNGEKVTGFEKEDKDKQRASVIQ